MTQAIVNDLVRWDALGRSCFRVELLTYEAGVKGHIWMGISGPGTPQGASPDVILDPWQSGGFSLFPLSEIKFESRQPLIFD